MLFYILSIKNEDERNFYIIETAENNWSKRELDRQINASLFELLLLSKDKKGVKEIGERFGFKSVCYGHAGDGNLHINIIKENMSDADWNDELPKGIREIFNLCIDLKGTISGEHGIGYVQKEYMDIPFSTVELNLQKNIKLVFDPNQILNPGKVFN